MLRRRFTVACGASTALDVGLDGLWRGIAEGHILVRAAARGCHERLLCERTGAGNGQPVHDAATEQRRGTLKTGAEKEATGTVADDGITNEDSRGEMRMRRKVERKLVLAHRGAV